MINGAGLAPLAVGVVALCVAVASPADGGQAPGGRDHHADPQGYLAHLDRHGVGYGSAADAVALARQVCEALHVRVPLVEVGRRVMASGFEPLQAAHIVNAAAGRVCPDLAGYVEQQMASHRGAASATAALA